MGRGGTRRSVADVHVLLAVIVGAVDFGVLGGPRRAVSFDGARGRSRVVRVLPLLPLLLAVVALLLFVVVPGDLDVSFLSVRLPLPLSFPRFLLAGGAFAFLAAAIFVAFAVPVPFLILFLFLLVSAGGWRPGASPFRRLFSGSAVASTSPASSARAARPPGCAVAFRWRFGSSSPRFFLLSISGSAPGSAAPVCGVRAPPAWTSGAPPAPGARASPRSAPGSPVSRTRSGSPLSGPGPSPGASAHLFALLVSRFNRSGNERLGLPDSLHGLFDFFIGRVSLQARTQV